jgi:hypothetical protein
MRVVLQCIKGIYAHGTELSNGNHHSKEAYFSNLADHVSYMKGEFDLLVHVEDAPESILDITGPSAKPDKHIVDAMQRIHLFAILHEFGHIALKHAASEDVVDQIAACYDGVEINASKMQEFKADEFAGNYIWDNSETGFLPNVATVSAITQFFFILQFTNPSSINQSAELHPTPLERLVNILSYWNSIDRTGQFPKIYESATYFAHVCHAIMNRLVEVGVCEDPTGM